MTVALDAWTPPAPKVMESPEEEPGPSTPRVKAGNLEPLGSDPMDTLRDINIRFFKLTLSQKSEIAGRLGLLEDEDINLPDFERFRRVFLRARERGLVAELDREVSAAADR